MAQQFTQEFGYEAVRLGRTRQNIANDFDIGLLTLTGWLFRIRTWRWMSRIGGRAAA